MSEGKGGRRSPTRSEIRRVIRQGDTLDVSVGTALPELCSIMRAIEENGFAAVCRDRLADEFALADPLVAVERIAERVTRGLTGRPGRLLGKAIQEAILDACGLDYDLEQLDLDRGFSELFSREGLRGFVESVLSLHVFYSVWFAIDGGGFPSPGKAPFARRLTAVRKITDQAVSTAIARADASGLLQRIETDPEAGVALIEAIRDQF